MYVYKLVLNRSRSRARFVSFLLIYAARIKLTSENSLTIPVRRFEGALASAVKWEGYTSSSSSSFSFFFRHPVIPSGEFYAYTYVYLVRIVCVCVWVGGLGKMRTRGAENNNNTPTRRYIYIHVYISEKES